MSSGARPERWRRGAGLVAVLTVGFALTPPGSAAQEPLPRVLVITTGGTIASRPDAPSLPGRELVAAVPELAGVARLEVEEFARIGSSAMTPDHWLRLARRIQGALEGDPGLAGVVVTHGTDSMEETAWFLHLTVADPRPVVLTGSMRSADAVSADGPGNLLAAVRTAVAPEAGGKGVLVVLNDRIGSARDVRKTNNLRVDAFRSPETGYLGTVDPDRVVFHRAPLARHAPESGFRLREIDSLPPVPVVADYAGSDGSVIRFWREKEVAGIVVQAFGGGRTSPETARAALEAAASGVPVVLSSRVPGGRVLERRVPGPGGPRPMTGAGLVAGRGFGPHRARILLMLALTRTSDPGEIQAIFDEH